MGTSTLFCEDGVIGKMFENRGDDLFFRGFVVLGDQVLFSLFGSMANFVPKPRRSKSPAFNAAWIAIKVRSEEGLSISISVTEIQAVWQERVLLFFTLVRFSFNTEVVEELGRKCAPADFFDV